jgi:hypothetical protein
MIRRRSLKYSNHVENDARVDKRVQTCVLSLLSDRAKLF